MIEYKIGRSLYGVAIAVYGFQQLIYGNFRNVQLPAWQTYIPLLAVWAYMGGVALIGAGVAIIIGKKTKALCLILGGIFLFLFLFIHIPFEIFGEINSSKHLALWTNALKGLALSGGAFIVAGFSSDDRSGHRKTSVRIKFLERIIPFGRIFFSIPMISFGITHFMYADHVASLVPEWFPDRPFWTYFSAVTLIASGTAIILKIRQGVIAMLLSIMIFLWMILLHIPRAIADPYIARSNEISSVFDALAFSGIALLIAIRTYKADLNEILN